jgi:hypothetical protein
LTPIGIIPFGRAVYRRMKKARTLAGRKTGVR